MNYSWLNKCKNIQNGLKKIQPNNQISHNYITQAENTLSSIKQLIEKGDMLWASVMIYYCAYYSLYSFLQKLGVKSENHSCSIEFFLYMTGNDELYKAINIFKQSRIDSQYYLKLHTKEEIENNYKQVQDFYIQLYNLCNEDISQYKQKLEDFFDKLK